MAGRTDSFHKMAQSRAVKQAQVELARRLTRFSIAEYTANQNAALMVQVLVGIATDINLPPEIRRQCALDVIERSDGKIPNKIMVARDPVPEAGGFGGHTLDHEVHAATEEAALLAQAEHYISGGTDPETWPEAVRNRFGVEAVKALEVAEKPDEDD